MGSMRQANMYSLEGSTDIGGLSPWLAQSIWKRYPQVTGLELIAWRWSTADFLTGLASSPDNNVPITRLHGTMIHGDGVLRTRSKVNLYDFALEPDPTLIRLASQYDLGVLIHAPHAANGFASQVHAVSQPRDVWIENHVGGESGLLLALEQTKRLADIGISTHLMIDLAHYLEPWQSLSNYARRFNTLLNQIHDLSQVIPVGLHFPVGDDPHDSLDILHKSHVSSRMLAEITQAVAYVCEIVFEYQSPKWRYMLPTAMQQQQVWQRLDRVMARLGESGIVRV
jgi:hypothetical protein